MTLYITGSLKHLIISVFGIFKAQQIKKITILTTLFHCLRSSPIHLENFSALENLSLEGK